MQNIQEIKSRITYNFGKYQRILKKWVNTNSVFWNEQLKSRELNLSIPVPANQLRDHVHQNAQPIFVLSTGRCGTKLITKILSANPNFEVYHAPFPELTPFSHTAYHKKDHESASLAFEASRYEYIRNDFLTGQRYVETNNRITFFCYAIAKLYPEAQFIHLYRNIYKICRKCFVQEVVLQSTHH